MKVIFLHGFGFDARIWKNTLSLLNESLETYCPDLPGFGNSDDPSNYSMGALADWIDGLIKMKVPNDFILVGHSMGGYAALMYLKKYGLQNCKGILLLHSHPFADSEEKKKERLKKSIFINEHKKSVFLNPFYISVFKDGIIPSNFESLRAQYISQISKKSLSEYMMSMAQREDFTDELSRWDIPVGIYHGIGDQLISQEVFLKSCIIPKACYLHQDNSSGHMSMIENPVHLKEYLEQFLSYCNSIKADN